MGDQPGQREGQRRSCNEKAARVRPFAATLELLAGEVRRRESGSDRAASLLTEMLLIQVLRAVLAGRETSASVGWVAGLRDPRIGSALAAMQGEPERPWSVDSLAERAGLSRSAFAERFAQKLGRTPMSYLAQWRLQDAARLLRDTELSISEIQQRLGYGSAAPFDRAFKRVHRISPSHYRRRFLAAARAASVVPAEVLARRRSG
jgi:transcriptional regulator GlxA family with amidase domain